MNHHSTDIEKEIKLNFVSSARVVRGCLCTKDGGE